MDALREANRVLRPSGELVVLELDNPPRLSRRLFAGFWFFYWLPFNFETPTRRDMFRHGLATEVRAAGFTNIRKTNYFGSIFQVVQALASVDDPPP
jgi:ubiquinone/menaquinone biosynthesis C-methylase UbiE